jgi:hypothetical protein
MRAGEDVEGRFERQDYGSFRIHPRIVPSVPNPLRVWMEIKIPAGFGY